MKKIALTALAVMAVVGVFAVQRTRSSSGIY